jgi:hypothetical protein
MIRCALAIVERSYVRGETPGLALRAFACVTTPKMPVVTAYWTIISMVSRLGMAQRPRLVEFVR